MPAYPLIADRYPYPHVDVIDEMAVAHPSLGFIAADLDILLEDRRLRQGAWTTAVRDAGDQEQRRQDDRLTG
ncbi:MAG: hypothetical protein U5N53_12480 [Mycobacterium sp.]|nr:hypothetical protein [Mycobacterium sp.]